MGSLDFGSEGEGHLKIAFVSEYPASPEAVVGGVQAVVRRLASAIAHRRGYEVHVVSCELGRTKTVREVVEGVHIHRFPMSSRWGNATLGWAERRATARELRAIAPDIANAHVLGPAALGAADAGIPWVATAHGIQSEAGRALPGWKGKIRGLTWSMMEKMCLRRTRHLIVINPYVVESLERELRGVKTYAIENPVEEAFFEIEGGGNPGRILVTGRVRPQKGSPEMIDALGLLARQGVQPEVHFAGPADEPTFVDSLRDRARRLGVDAQIRFLGPLSPTDLRREMATAGLLVHPSLQETAPLAIMEAMAGRLAVVATQVGGVRHLLAEGAAGWLVPPGNAVALAAAIQSALESREERESMVREARRIAEARFRLESVVRRTLQVFEGIVTESGRKAA